MHFRLVLSLLSLLALIPANGFSQYVKVRDMEAWTGAKISKELSRKWTLSVEEQTRLHQNMSKLDDILAEMGAEYKLNPRFRLALGARGIRHKTNSGDFESRMRLNFDSEYKQKKGASDFDFRLRLQSRLDSDEDLLLNVARLKAGWRWNPKNTSIDPFASAEIFIRLPGRSGFGYPSFRTSMGGIWKINKKNHVRLFYHLEWCQEEYYALWINRFGIRYILRL